jgi:membrane protein DedA with SNARE-associated domain
VLLASLSTTLTDFVGNHGLYAVFALMLIDAVFPAASELVMVYGGALAAGAFAHKVGGFGHGIDAYIAIALAGTIGYLLGSWIGWWIGLRGGRPLVARHGKWLHLNEEKLDRAERWFQRWEDWGVFLGRLTPRSGRSRSPASATGSAPATRSSTTLSASRTTSSPPRSSPRSSTPSCGGERRLH